MFHFGSKTQRPETIPDVVHQQLARGEQMLLIDVREPGEYLQGHIAHSILVPLGQLSLRLNELPRDRSIVVVCRSGNRSGVATDLLRRAGFDAVNLRGGMVQWAKRGLPVERRP